MFHRIAIWRVFVTLDFSTFQHRVMVAALLQKPIGSALSWKRRANMEYFAGLDVSMAETQICVMGRNGAVIHKAKVPSTPADIAAELASFQPADASYSRPAEWLRCSTMVYANSD